jgi:hypothetical protein
MLQRWGQYLIQVKNTSKSLQKFQGHEKQKKTKNEPEKKNTAGHWWLTPVILAEIRRVAV